VPQYTPGGLGLTPDTDFEQVQVLARQLSNLTPSQQEWVQAVVGQFQLPHTYWRDSGSNLISETVLNRLGDVLRIHHAFSRQPLSKDRFEFALEAALNRSGVRAQLNLSRTNPGHDITIEGVPVSLKTEAAKNIRRDSLHISKFMELGKGEWDLEVLREQFFRHMRSYDRIFQLRCLVQQPQHYEYELVEIPKALLEEARTGLLEIQHNSRQNPQPGYCRVYGAGHIEKFALYFDGGTERKLQIKGIRKELCKVHSTWRFQSVVL
jgi:type II restriction enzyme